MERNILNKAFSRLCRLFNRPSDDVVTPVDSITCGERDEHGFADTYINGQKTNLRMLLFDEDQIKKLHEAQKPNLHLFREPSTTPPDGRTLLCPECGAKLIEKWSGVKCSKCDYWFCF